MKVINFIISHFLKVADIGVALLRGSGCLSLSCCQAIGWDSNYLKAAESTSKLTHVTLICWQLVRGLCPQHMGLSVGCLGGPYDMVAGVP